MSSKIMLCSVPCNIPWFVLCILFADISVYCVAFVDMNMVLRWLVWRESGSSIASFSGVWRLPMSFCFPSLFVCFVLFFCFCFGLCSIVKQYRSTLSRSPSVSSIHSPWVFTPRFHFLVFFLFLFFLLLFIILLWSQISPIPSSMYGLAHWLKVWKRSTVNDGWMATGYVFFFRGNYVNVLMFSWYMYALYSVFLLPSVNLLWLMHTWCTTVALLSTWALLQIS